MVRHLEIQNISCYIKMLTSWRAYFTGGLEVTDTEMKFICLGLLGMELNHARGVWGGG